MKRCVIIGGGFAGLSAAVYLIKAGCKVDLYEASPKLGGRAYSFKDDLSSDYIDNGQHIMMGCYDYTIDFLKIIGAENKILRQDNLKVNFVDKSLGVVPLKTNSKIYPFNLLSGILKYSAIDFPDRIRIVQLFIKIMLNADRNSNNISIHKWLKKNNQSERSIKAFWEIIAVGSLNAGIEQASANIFKTILKEIFLKGNQAATIIFPENDLSSMYCEHALEFITKNGSSVNLLSRINSIDVENDKVVSINLDNKKITGFDYLVLAVPSFSLNKILSENIIKKINLPAYEYSSILTIHIWLEENPFKESFYGLIDSDIHWIFNKGKHITTVTSNAGKFDSMNKEDIFELVNCEIKKYFPEYAPENIVRYKVIKEKRATFIPTPELIDKRPSVICSIKNLFLAGDWIDTGLPATIEGAVKSGKMAADEILNSDFEFKN